MVYNKLNLKLALLFLASNKFMVSVLRIPLCRVQVFNLSLLMAIVANEDLELHHMYVKIAFLGGDLFENICMERPEDLDSQDKPAHVRKLEKEFYGLKQAPRKWSLNSDTFMWESLQFQSCPYDPFFYVLRKKGMTVSVEVGNFLIAVSSHQSVIAATKALGALLWNGKLRRSKALFGYQNIRKLSSTYIEYWSRAIR